MGGAEHLGSSRAESDSALAVFEAERGDRFSIGQLPLQAIILMSVDTGLIGLLNGPALAVDDLRINL